MLPKGTFVISIDHEFAWGYADHVLKERDKERIRGEMGIVRRLIALFEKYGVPATWAIVAHLLEHGCKWEGTLPHPEYPRPIYKGEKQDWFRDHPPQNEYSDILWFDAENLVGEMKKSIAGHEIASHGYAHILYDEAQTSHPAIMADIYNLGKVHRVHDISFTSFVFPRNVEGYHRHLKLNGFTAYRGVSQKWNDKYTGAMRRFTNLFDYYVPKGRTVLPDTKKFGLVNIPDSMLLMGRNGPRRFILPSVVVRKAKKGLKRAARRKEIFHLWFHPSNFSYSTETQFRIFEKILKYAADMREKGDIDIKTMQQVTETVQKS